jgi:hypothetical protein
MFMPSQFHRNATLILMSGLLLAVVTGLTLGFGLYTVVAPLVLILPAIYLLMRPDISLVFFTGLTLVIAGSLKYFFDLGQFQWALSALGIALLGYALVNTIFSNHVFRITTSGLSPLALLWWGTLIFSSAANSLPMLDWLVGLRIYLPVFGIFAYLAYCRPKEKLLKNILLFMLMISTIQWIFCLYQKLAIVPLRIAGHYQGSSWDSIVGTFGGEKFGGGESGSLGIYLSIIFVLTAALRKFKQIERSQAIVVFVTSFAAMAMVESKVIAVMIPLGLFLVFRDYALMRPFKFLAGCIAVAGAMATLLVAYYYLYWHADNNLGLVDALYSRFAYSFDPSFQASTTNLGRIKSLIFWWDKHGILDNPLTLLLGHGLASAVSASSIIGEGVAVKTNGVMLDVTGASKLLWETGVIGLTIFLAIFAVGFVRARQLKANAVLPGWHRASMSGVEAAMVLMPLSIFYEVTVVSSPPMQFMAMFFLGYVAYWWREASEVRLV